MVEAYNKSQFIEFLADDMTGPGFGGEIEIKKINEQFADVDVIPARYAYSVMLDLYGLKNADREYRIMQTKVTGYINI
jgi:hypothetical protein